MCSPWQPQHPRDVGGVQHLRNTAMDPDFNQLFKIFGYEQENDQPKFYLQIRNDDKDIETIKNLKSEDIFMRKIPH